MPLILVSISLLMFFLPITVEIKLLLSLKDKKLFYATRIYDKIYINGGYFEIENKRVVLNYGKNKSKKLSFKDALFDNTRTDVVKHIDFIKNHSAVLIGGDDYFEKYFLSVAILDVSSITYSILKENKPYLKFKNDVIILDETDKSGFICETVFAIKVLVICVILIKKVYGGIIYLCKKKKSLQTKLEN